MDSSNAPLHEAKSATKNRCIPPEIIEEILVNLPVKPLLRFSSVSRSWNSMIRGLHFVKKHRIRAAVLGRERIVLKRFIYYPPPSSFPPSAVSPEHSPVDSEATAPFFPSERTVSIKAFCDEMLFLEDTSNRSVSLWNPSMREGFVLPTPNFANEYVTVDGRNTWLRRKYVYGLGHDAANDDYKIVKVDLERDKPTAAELYSLRSNSWKEIKPFERHVPPLICGEMAVFLGGALHWLCWDEMMYSSAIVSFDLSTESYGPELAPPELDKEYYIPGMKLSILKGRLCYCMNDFLRGRFVMWMMEDYGVAKSWTTKLDMATHYVPHDNALVIPFYLFDDGRFLIGLFRGGCTELIMAYIQSGGGEEQEKERLVLLSKDEETQLGEYMQCNHFHSISNFFVYVESLASPAAYVLPAGAPM